MYLDLDLAFSSSGTTSILAMIILGILDLHEHGAFRGKPDKLFLVGLQRAQLDMCTRSQRYPLGFSPNPCVILLW